MATSLGTYPNCTWSNLRIGHAVLIATRSGDGHTTCITGLKNGCDGSQASHWLVTSNWGDKICQMSLDTQIKYYTDREGGLYNGQVYYTTFGKNIGAGATSDVRITLSCAN